MSNNVTKAVARKLVTVRNAGLLGVRTMLGNGKFVFRIAYRPNRPTQRSGGM